MIYDVFSMRPGFEFFGVDDVLRLRSLGVSRSWDEVWDAKCVDVAVEVLGVDEGFCYGRLEEAFGEGRDDWEYECDVLDGFTLADLEAEGLSAGEVMRLWESGCIVGDDVGGELRFARAQFWGGVGVSGLVVREEFFEVLGVFRRLGVSAADAGTFLFEPRDDYGFLAPAELLLSGVGELRDLVVADAHGCAVERRGVGAVDELARASVGTVPTPGVVVGLVGRGVNFGAVFGGGFGEFPYELVSKVAEGLGIPVSVLMCRVKGMRYGLGRRREGTGGLMDELEGLGWSDGSIAEFLRVPSPWFGVVPPLEYARLGDEYVGAVVTVAEFIDSRR